MNKRTSKDTKPDLVAEASGWFIEFRTGEVTSSDRARFDEWLRRSPEHIQVYLEIAAGWAELPTSDPQGRIDITELIQRARAGGDENVVPLPTASSVRRGRRRVGVSAWASLAAVAVVVGLAIGVYWYQGSIYRTGVGEQRTVRLLDGSTVELNALSRIRVRLSRTMREIDLTEGQGLFHVAKDPSRPFIVYSDGTTVRAVGTQFDVYRKHDETVVTVLEGRVAVAEAGAAISASDQKVRQDAPIFLTAGEQVTMPAREVAKSVPKSAPKPKYTDPAVATAWVQKRLIFEDTPLSEVADEFNRYNLRRLLIDPELRSVGISGVYSSTDPDSLLGFLRAQPNIQLSETDQEIHVALREKK
jgi:transmembrane sensor